MLHVHTGDCAAETLKASGIPGVHVVWTELLMLGPLRPDRGLDPYRRERADCLSRSTGGARSPGQCLELLRRQDEALSQWAQHDETVLWVDGCLYDQAILVRLLSRFGETPAAISRLRLVCADRYPGRPDFHGLGELAPAEMASLLPARAPVTPDQVALAQRAWQAMCAATPRDLERLADQPTEALPCLKAALRRWLEQYPASDHGLCRLQQEILAALQDPGEQSPVALFRSVSAAERPAFFGDSFLWKCLNDMAFCRVPLIRLDADTPLPLWETEGIGRRRVQATAEGLAVAAGRCDAIALNGIDRWIGGVHLQGVATSPWRWNRQTGALVEALG